MVGCITDLMDMSLSKLQELAQLVENSPAMWETWVRSLGWEDSLEKRKATHSSILAWRIPWTGEPGRLQSTGFKETQLRQLSLHTCAINH